MKVFLYIAAALCGYVVAGMNPAIAISKAIYHRDIRECGSGNPGFTNFKRTFGNKWAWWVLVLDLADSVRRVDPRYFHGSLLCGVYGGQTQGELQTADQRNGI